MAYMPVGTPIRRVVGTPSPVQRINPVGGPVAPVRGPFRPRAVISGGGYNPTGTTGLTGPDHVAMPSSFKKGGKVKKTGWAKVHKGEKIIPAGAAAKQMGGKKKKKSKKKRKK